MQLPNCFVNFLAQGSLSGILRLPLQAQELGGLMHMVRHGVGSFSYTRSLCRLGWETVSHIVLWGALVPLSLPASWFLCYFSASVGRIWLFLDRLPGEVVNCLMSLVLSVLGTEYLGIVSKGCPSVALSRDQS